jgi:hypothetical protein
MNDREINDTITLLEDILAIINDDYSYIPFDTLISLENRINAKIGELLDCY